MLRTVSEQPTLWESILPPEVLGLPAELKAIDGLLDDERFFAPYRRFFHATIGRPSIPIETYPGSLRSPRSAPAVPVPGLWPVRLSIPLSPPQLKGQLELEP